MPKASLVVKLPTFLYEQANFHSMFYTFTWALFLKQIFIAAISHALSTHNIEYENKH